MLLSGILNTAKGQSERVSTYCPSVFDSVNNANFSLQVNLQQEQLLGLCWGKLPISRLVSPTNEWLRAQEQPCMF